MPIKRNIKKTTRTQPTKSQTLQRKTHSLCNWLFKKPMMFALLSFFTIFAVTFVYSIVAAIFNSSAVNPLMFLVFLSFCWTIYYMIKKLPHGEMYRDDFVAITNGCSLITILIPIITLFFVGYSA